MSFAYRLTFLLPTVISLVPAGRHHPCIAGAILTIDPLGIVAVEGASREAVFDQAARFLRVVGKGHGPLSIAGVLEHEDGPRDGWSISVNAQVSFAPTALGAEIFPRQQSRQQPVIRDGPAARSRPRLVAG